MSRDLPASISAINQIGASADLLLEGLAQAVRQQVRQLGIFEMKDATMRSSPSSSSAQSQFCARTSRATAALVASSTVLHRLVEIEPCAQQRRRDVKLGGVDAGVAGAAELHGLEAGVDVDRPSHVELGGADLPGGALATMAIGVYALPAELLRQALGHELEIGLHVGLGDLGELVARRVPRRAAVPGVGLVSVGVDAVNDELLPVARISILWISSLPGALKLADIFGNGVMVRNGSVRFGRRPKRTGILPRSENNSLAVSSATVAAPGR